MTTHSYRCEKSTNALRLRKAKEIREDLEEIATTPNNDEGIAHLVDGFGISPATAVAYINSIQLIETHAPALYAYFYEQALFPIEHIVGFCKPLLAITPKQLETIQDQLIESLKPNKQDQLIPQPGSLRSRVARLLPQLVEGYTPPVKKPRRQGISMRLDKAHNWHFTGILPEQSIAPILSHIHTVSTHFSWTPTQAFEKILIDYLGSRNTATILEKLTQTHSTSTFTETSKQLEASPLTPSDHSSPNKKHDNTLEPTTSMSA
ncbi:MAG: hypothetical protein Q4A31_03490 [Corynebacterium sp.]|uniref:hypothetical protein n=1 Tax=Corynebacterium sp. TaxID=1720 RepID=UPI0026DB95DF|nr:hypothetical protein [Corynebacterium sp.]MDO4760969.1 hypothetical protein [Corynebacterium sp.]